LRDQVMTKKINVRPILNLKTADGARRMRAIAEEAFALVREYKGSHSGEHGDGLVRSEWHLPMFGPRLVAAFGAVKRAFDPAGGLNPGKVIPTLTRCAEYGKMHVKKGLLPFPELERF
jgi:FAD/FMN-containing dehydrogenase